MRTDPPVVLPACTLPSALLDREWVEVREHGLVLVQPDALLKSWRESYRQPAKHHISGYTVLHGDQLRDRLSGSLNPGPQSPRAICASNSAAEWIAPYVRGGTQSFYADEPSTFRNFGDFGPSSVRRFVEGSDLLGDRTADQWQQDAFGQVDAWLRSLGVRE